MATALAGMSIAPEDTLTAQSSRSIEQLIARRPKLATLDPALARSAWRTADQVVARFDIAMAGLRPGSVRSEVTAATGGATDGRRGGLEKIIDAGRGDTTGCTTECVDHIGVDRVRAGAIRFPCS